MTTILNITVHVDLDALRRGGEDALLEIGKMAITIAARHQAQIELEQIERAEEKLGAWLYEGF